MTLKRLSEAGKKGSVMAVKKQWYEIVTPEIFGNRVVGETLAVDPRQLVGRTINVNLLELSKNYSKFYVKVRLQIEKVDGNRAQTKLMGHDCMRERIYRMVQRHGRRVDAIQDVTTKDGVKLRVKTVFMLIKRVGASTKDATRKMMRDLVDEAAAKSSFDEFINTVITGDLQHKLKKDCSKIYPIGSIEIRKTEVMEGKVAAAA